MKISNFFWFSAFRGESRKNNQCRMLCNMYCNLKIIWSHVSMTLCLAYDDLFMMAFWTLQFLFFFTIFNFLCVTAKVMIITHWNQGLTDISMSRKVVYAWLYMWLCNNSVITSRVFKKRQFLEWYVGFQTIRF